MANLDATEKLKAIAKAEGSMSSAEMREGSNATAKLLFRNENTAFQNVKSMKESLVMPTEAILQQKSTLTTKVNKQAVHSGEFGDSFTTPISYVQTGTDFNVSYKLAENNRFGYQEQMNHGLLNAMQTIRAEINNFAIAQLASQKTQVSAGSGLLNWDATNFKYTNVSGETNVGKQAFRIKSVARKNKYGQTLDIVGGQQLVADMTHFAAQGTANATNYGYQFNNLSLAEEETLDESSLGAGGFGYIMPSGLVGMSSWNEPINRKGGRGTAQSSDEGLFTVVSDPIIPGLMYDVHIKSGLADTVANGHTYYQDIVDKIEITAIYTFSHAMISVANETPIYAFEQL